MRSASISGASGCITCASALAREDSGQLHEFLVNENVRLVHAPENGPWVRRYYSVLFEDLSKLSLKEFAGHRGSTEYAWRGLSFMRDELQQLPGVGPSIAADLRRLNVRSVLDLAGRDPERLYARLCEITGQRQDPCVLYTFRCAVYAARTEKPEPELLKWWKWKGRRLK